MGHLAETVDQQDNKARASVEFIHSSESVCSSFAVGHGDSSSSSAVIKAVEAKGRLQPEALGQFRSTRSKVRLAIRP